MNGSILTFSSISKKVIMALAGLFLIVFLLVHLTINLFMLKGDGGESFNVFAHFMATNIIIKIFEYLLIGSFVIHMLYGVVLQIQNWLARPVRYKVTGKATTSFFSKYMIYTGVVVFIFLIIHFMDFWFKRIGLMENQTIISGGPHAGEPDFYSMAIYLFSQPAYSIMYIILILVLGFHLNHAFQSAFQTLGLDHSKYTPFIKTLATLYSIVITAGFCIIPIYFLAIYGA